MSSVCAEGSKKLASLIQKVETLDDVSVGHTVGVGHLFFAFLGHDGSSDAGTPRKICAKTTDGDGTGQAVNLCCGIALCTGRARSRAALASNCRRYAVCLSLKAHPRCMGVLVDPRRLLCE